MQVFIVRNKTTKEILGVFKEKEDAEVSIWLSNSGLYEEKRAFIEANLEILMFPVYKQPEHL